VLHIVTSPQVLIASDLLLNRRGQLRRLGIFTSHPHGILPISFETIVPKIHHEIRKNHPKHVYVCREIGLIWVTMHTLNMEISGNVLNHWSLENTSWIFQYDNLPSSIIQHPTIHPPRVPTFQKAFPKRIAQTLMPL
jgi:hypothetical protein